MSDIIDDLKPIPPPTTPAFVKSAVSFERALLLLEVVALAVTHGTTYAAITGVIANELADMNAVAQKELDDRAKKVRIEKEKYDAAMRAKVHADAAAERLAQQKRDEATKQAAIEADKKAMAAAPTPLPEPSHTWRQP